MCVRATGSYERLMTQHVYPAHPFEVYTDTRALPRTEIFTCGSQFVFGVCSFTDTGSVMLGKARGTLAGEAADGVDTQELTVVLFCRALIQVWKGSGRHDIIVVKD